MTSGAGMGLKPNVSLKTSKKLRRLFRSLYLIKEQRKYLLTKELLLS